MNHRRLFFTLGVNTMVFASVLAGCGSYGNDDKGAATGGTSGTATGGSGGTATGGTTATGGASGTPPTGGTSGSATGGSAPTGGAGGSGGSGVGGSAGSGGATGGSGGGGPSCSETAPCGGMLEGTWTAASCPIAVSGVVDMAATGLGCPTAPVTGSFQVSGTWTVESGGTFTDNTTTSGQLNIELTPPCKMISGTNTTCDRVVLGAIGINTITCVDNTTTMGCSCVAMIEQQGRPGFISTDHAMTGTLTTADNKVTTLGDGRTTEYSYCVAGNTLTMKLETAGPVGTLMGPIVFQK